MSDLSLADGKLLVVDQRNFSISPWSFGLALIGKSISVKSTIAREVLALLPV